MICPSGKRAFRSYHAAEREARRARKRHHNVRANRIYRCPLCNEWHSTHLRKPRS